MLKILNNKTKNVADHLVLNPTTTKITANNPTKEKIILINDHSP